MTDARPDHLPSGALGQVPASDNSVLETGRGAWPNSSTCTLLVPEVPPVVLLAVSHMAYFCACFNTKTLPITNTPPLIQWVYWFSDFHQKLLSQEI